MRTIHVTIPYHTGQNRVETNFEQVLNNIHNSIRGEKISFEFVSYRQHLNVYMTFEDSLYDFMVGQVYAIYPDAEILEVKDYVNSENIAGKKFYGCELAMTRSKIYPTQTYLDFEKDPLSGMFSIMSKIQDHEQCWVQVITQKMNDNFWFHFTNKLLRKFHAFHRIFHFRDNMKRGKGKEAKAQEKKWFDRKISNNMFHCSIRLLVLAPTLPEAKQKLHSLAKGIFQMNTSDLNSYKIKSESGSAAMLQSYKKRNMASKLLLDVKELTTVYHLPDPDEIPNTVYVMSRKNEPPLDLPRPLPESRTELSYFGHTNYHNSNIPFGINRADRRPPSLYHWKEWFRKVEASRNAHSR